MIISDGSVQTQIAAVGANNKALRVENRALEYGTLGHYSWGATSGIIPIIGTFGANGEIWQFRWSDATRLCVIRKIIIDAVVSTTMFAAGVPVELALLKSTSWSGVGTGGTRPTFSAQCKLRTSMGNSLIPANDVGISTTTALGAGTKTLETTPMSTAIGPNPITGILNGSIFAQHVLWDANTGDGGMPIVLAQNEGLSITVVNAAGTGTWRLNVRTQWAEVAAY